MRLILEDIPVFANESGHEKAALRSRREEESGRPRTSLSPECVTESRRPR